VPEHAIDLEASPEKALAAVGRAAEDWGAEFQSGQLRLPVVAGIRRGLMTGTVEVGPAEGGSRVVFRPEKATYYVQTQAVVILLLAVAGGLLTLVWPFFPKLIAVAPFGAVLALGGWFLVVSRLRTSGPDEFLDTVAVNAQEPGPTGMSPS
jgi:fatty acid desaturase